jgi:hypothetical protein
LVLFVACAASAQAQQQQDSLTWELATVPPPDTAPKKAAFPPEPTRSPAESPHAAALKGLRAISLKEGEGRIALGGSERLVRPGDALGNDVVKSIEPGRMVLSRKTADVGEAIVIVSFDAQGRGRVRVFAGRDPSPVLPKVR